ncbi:MAG: carnitine-CoA ligase, partial [Thermoleophilaceae bacterium]|nr:carnitine-CoA ligase [Thermoleophilaceae bacterium]
AEAYARACSVANGLIELGVEPGECVAIMAENSPDSICTWLGINLAAAVEVAINTGYRGQTLEHALQISRARVIYVEPGLIPRIAEIRDSLTSLELLVVYGEVEQVPDVAGVTVRRFADVVGSGDGPPDRPVRPQDLASVVYTSGTTGPAKGVMMPHGQVQLFARLAVEGVRMSERDVFYCFIPLYHVAGKFMGILGSMMVGGKVVLDDRFSAEDWLARVREHGVTLCLLHGPLVEMINQLPEAPDDADNPVERIIASPFPAQIAESFERRFGLRGIETWGMTEVTIPIWQRYEDPVRPGCCGRVREDHFELRIVDPDTDAELGPGEVGELTLRPRAPWTMMQGYMRMPEITLETWRNLWFHTGDLGYRDEQGYVYFVDRAKERIRRRAENISSYDIEAAARPHPGVADCAAVGVPSEFAGDDDILLCVIPADGCELKPVELMEHLVTRLPHFMVPRYVRLMEDFPRTPTGKVQKAVLRTEGLVEGTWDRKTAGVSLRDLAQR